VTGTSRVRVQVDGRLTRITLCAASRGNPVDPQMVSALARAVSAAKTSEAAVLVLEAEGRMFCVGGDVAGFAVADDPSLHVERLATDFHEIITTLMRMPAIVVTVVQGMAAGAGVSLAAAGDVVLAARSASFVLAYTKVGLSPDGGASLLVQSVGLHRALHFALLNPVMAADAAYEAGLVSRVVDDDHLDAAVADVVEALLSGSREAQVATKRLLRAQAVRDGLDAALAAETASIARLAGTFDGREGVDAFVKKRPPVFPSSADGA